MTPRRLKRDKNEVHQGANFSLAYAKAPSINRTPETQLGNKKTEINNDL